MSSLRPLLIFSANSIRGNLESEARTLNSFGITLVGSFGSGDGTQVNNWAFPLIDYVAVAHNKHRVTHQLSFFFESDQTRILSIGTRSNPESSFQTGVVVNSTRANPAWCTYYTHTYYQTRYS